jgi:glycosyltransferase involved in cell wall biosynthesis
MSDPLVSVLIPAYNAGKYLLPSVESILGQRYRNLEIWVVDDGSTDASFESLAGIRDPRLRVLHQSNRGKPTTLNALLDRIAGSYYALEDADDMSHPDRIARQVDLLESNPDLAGCFTGYELIINDRGVAPRFRAKGVSECAADIERFDMPGHDPTAMFRMSMVGDLRYEPRLSLGEGHDLILRVGERFPLQVIGECLYSYRVHLGSITRRKAAMRYDFNREVARRACERRGIDPTAVLKGIPDGGGPMRSRELDNNVAGHFIESAIDQREGGRRWGALGTARLCWQLNPLDLHYYKALAYALAPPSLTQWFRRRRAGGYPVA